MNEEIKNNISDEELEHQAFLEKRKLYMREYRAKMAVKLKKKREREKLKKKKERERKKEKEKLKKLKKKEREKLKKMNAPKKRRVGRPRKIGRKKKWKRKKVPKPRIYKKLPPFCYKIIKCTNHRQRGIVGKYRTKEAAYEVFYGMKKNPNQVVFPKTFYAGDSVAKNYINEYVLITTENVKGNLSYRDEYGKVVEAVSDNDKWVIVDKFKYETEETFWVFGYDKISDRKTYTWIYDNILLSNLETNYDYKRVMCFLNKIVIKDDYGNIDMIICKCENDAVKMYNMMYKAVKKEKIRQIIFCGDYSAISEKRRRLVNELIDLTGWNKYKLCMKNQTFYNRNV